MLLEQLRNNKLGHLFFLPLVGLALWARTIYETAMGATLKYGSFHMPFFRFIIEPFREPSFAVYGAILGLLILILQAFMIAQLANKYHLYEERSFMPAYIYVVLMSLHVALQKLHPALIANFFVLVALDHLFASIKNRRTLRNIFYAALLISIGSLIYLKSFIFLLLVWIAVIFLKRSSLREFLLSVFAAGLPFLFVWAYYFIKTGNTREFRIDLGLVAVFKDMHYPLELMDYIAFGFILLIGLIALLRMFFHLRFRINTTRDQLLIIFFTLLFVVVAYFTGPFSLEIITFAAVALSIIIADYFHSIKLTWMTDAVVYAVLVMLIFVQIFA